MQNLTYHQRKLQRAGYSIIDFTHDEIVEHLLDVFRRDRDHLLTEAAADTSNRHKLYFHLDFDSIGDKKITFGGMVTYDKKKRRFTDIWYSDKHGWAVVFGIESKVAYFSYDFWAPLKKRFPNGTSMKNLTEYLRTATASTPADRRR